MIYGFSDLVSKLFASYIAKSALWLLHEHYDAQPICCAALVFIFIFKQFLCRDFPVIKRPSCSIKVTFRRR